MSESMHTWTIKERLHHLMATRGINPEAVVEGLAGKLSKSYVYYLLKGERENLSQDKIEILAAFFDVSPLFFSRDPAHWVPPVSGKTIQYALRTAGELDDRSRSMLEALMRRATEIAADRRTGQE